ncbi:mitochondrial protein [Phytophthora palmivora]|uniref:Mitochondrial protein n=1 Tax=Phytophthora palmivora TaxID=4796 RepID=A0A2P4Y7T6_9STRA|nr:mitochondrial protein [Phytophthora palmivora]
MASFRLLLGLAALLELEVYGGDVNTAYLNAWLGIRQYLHSISGYPCRLSGHSYVVLKALYGLRQSGREWNSELNDWFIQRGYQRSLTEPCLYYLFEDDTIVYVLVYVDDILVATNSKQFKDQLFMDLDNTYGLKDQGLLTQYLVYVDDILVATNSKQFKDQLFMDLDNTYGLKDQGLLTQYLEKESADSSFPYREAIGMLMYLATSTRPDLAFALGQLRTLDYGIKYEKNKKKKQTNSFKADFKQFFHKLPPNYTIAPTQYLTHVQAGTEPFVGNATLTVSKYTAAVNTV